MSARTDVADWLWSIDMQCHDSSVTPLHDTLRFVVEGSRALRPLKVVHLDFSRNTQAFHELLQTSKELDECRQTLNLSGAHLFCRLEQVQDITMALRREGWLLARRIVVTTCEFEALVRDVILSRRASPSSREQVRLRSREQVRLTDRQDAVLYPPGQARFDNQEEVPLDDRGEARFDQFLMCYVKHTFIDIPDTNSIYSAPSTMPRTMSTTDANPRTKAKARPNPRPLSRRFGNSTVREETYVDVPSDVAVDEGSASMARPSGSDLASSSAVAAADMYEEAAVHDQDLRSNDGEETVLTCCFTRKRSDVGLPCFAYAP